MEYDVSWTMPVLPLGSTARESLDKTQPVQITFNGNHAFVKFVAAAGDGGGVVQGNIAASSSTECAGELNGENGVAYTFSARVEGSAVYGAICGYDPNTQDSGGQWGGNQRPQ